MKPYPKTKEQWWENVDDCWIHLIKILERYIGMQDMEDVRGNLTTEPRYIEILRMKKERNPELVRYFNGAWWNAPGSPSIHQIPGWGVLCDLCSEEHVLYEEKKG